MVTDPLINLPTQEKALFDAFSKAAAGRTADAVMGAAVNILINAIRQREPTRKEAEALWDTMFGRGKSLLLENHYNSVTGKRRTVFPFTQTISAPLHVADDEVRG